MQCFIHGNNYNKKSILIFLPNPINLSEPPSYKVEQYIRLKSNYLFCAKLKEIKRHASCLIKTLN